MTGSLSQTRGRPEPHAKIDQTRFGAGKGNCLAACVATLTGLDIEAVSEAIGMSDGGTYVDGVWQGGEHWYDRFCRAMRERGYEVHYSESDVPDGFCIMSGPAERGLLHSTVALNGEVWHDPHPSRAGLLEITDYLWLTPAALSPVKSGGAR